MKKTTLEIHVMRDPQLENGELKAESPTLVLRLVFDGDLELDEPMVDRFPGDEVKRPASQDVKSGG